MAWRPGSQRSPDRFLNARRYPAAASWSVASGTVSTMPSRPLPYVGMPVRVEHAERDEAQRELRPTVSEKRALMAGVARPERCSIETAETGVQVAFRMRHLRGDARRSVCVVSLRAGDRHP